MIDLQCPSYEYVMDMTWREFCLRRYRYLKVKEDEYIRQAQHTRMLAYWTLVSTGAIDTRKMSIEKFMPIEGGSKEKTRIENWQKEAFLKAVNDVVNESGSRTGGTS